MIKFEISEIHGGNNGTTLANYTGAAQTHDYRVECLYCVHAIRLCGCIISVWIRIRDLNVQNVLHLRWHWLLYSVWNPVNSEFHVEIVTVSMRCVLCIFWRCSCVDWSVFTWVAPTPWSRLQRHQAPIWEREQIFYSCTPLLRLFTKNDIPKRTDPVKRWRIWHRKWSSPFDIVGTQSERKSLPPPNHHTNGSNKPLPWPMNSVWIKSRIEQRIDSVPHSHVNRQKKWKNKNGNTSSIRRLPKIQKWNTCPNAYTRYPIVESA